MNASEVELYEKRNPRRLNREAKMILDKKRQDRRDAAENQRNWR